MRSSYYTCLCSRLISYLNFFVPSIHHSLPVTCILSIFRAREVMRRLNLTSNIKNKNFISKRDDKLPVNVNMTVEKSFHEGPLNLHKWTHNVVFHEWFPQTHTHTHTVVIDMFGLQSRVCLAASPLWSGWRTQLPQHGEDIQDGVCTRRSKHNKLWRHCRDSVEWLCLTLCPPLSVLPNSWWERDFLMLNKKEHAKNVW